MKSSCLVTTEVNGMRNRVKGAFLFRKFKLKAFSLRLLTLGYIKQRLRGQRCSEQALKVNI